MQQSVSETLTEATTVVFDVLVMVVLTAAGFRAELHSAALLSTDTMVALWFAYMGAVALYAGLVVFGADRIGPRLRTLVTNNA
jgi:hypothetical protein